MHTLTPLPTAPSTSSVCRQWRLPLHPRQHCRRYRHFPPPNSSVSFDPEVIPPPPPPPPPPPFRPPEQVDRRRALFSAAAAAVGLALGFGIGSQPATVPGLERSEQEEIDALRTEAKFRRGYDGHVFAQARDGSWFEVRLDAQLPGTVLLRSEKDGCVYFITLNITQVDLTDDYVVISLFGDGTWENSIQKVVGRDELGSPADVYLDQEAFRDLSSIITPEGDSNT